MTDKGYTNSGLLIETDVLEADLGADDLRVIDCNVVMGSKPGGGYDIKSGRSDYDEAHIPGAIFLDFLTELSGDHPSLRFMMPTPEEFARVVGEAGIGDEHRVVVYSRGANFWATRLFLMFRAFGFNNCRVLNGAWDKWSAESRPTTTGVPDYSDATFTPNPQPGQIIGKDEVLAAVQRKDTCLINALSPEIFSGATVNASYGRPGHIAGSVNLYAYDLINKTDNTFADAAALREKFQAVGVLDQKNIITYCGGGISATTDSFALMLLGRDDVALYDGSMTEWGPDESLPMSTLVN
ncbi:MAG: sulfurtransferase [Rhodospirillaceae bacterium]|jgi:thiosulfate/3-mercaptopyruvate sulfurtransferase|nr:sulfurtransferase [Rhodospirillaceae bacterium]MBT5242262.1 sulfurtransferase [Rhodospirillaceae bacterium]MBT5565990.1 sulfurtransferase [Rhodospirillaceae bacterium]MBT6088590.1 sulfurtransferase [Rhodospirillaceae bacterium]MBT7452222.1 sulfurtransferase [Rhodospirillaceae bacterium]